MKKLFILIACVFALQTVTKAQLQSDVSDSVWSIVVPEATSIDIDMGKVLVNVEKDSIIHAFIKNIGTYQVSVKTITFTGTDASCFAVGAGKPPFIIQQGQTVPVEFAFKPNSPGIKNAKINIENLDTTLVQNITGEGISPSLSIVSKLVNFGTVEVGNHKDTTLVLVKNIGVSQIDVTNTKMLGPDLAQFDIISGGGSFTLLPGDTRPLTLTFKPKYIGRTSGEIGFDFAGVGSPARAQLFGQGIGGMVLCTDDSAYPGEKRTVHLQLIGAKANTVQTIAQQFKAKLRFMHSVIATTDNKIPMNFTEDMATIELQSSVTNSDILQSIEFIAGLGKAEQTYIEILEFKWLDENGDEVEYETETQDGLFKILGICHEGGTRLINPETKTQLMMVKPNPASDEAEIEYQLAGKENSKLFITNLQGEVVKTIFDRTNNNFELQRYKIDISKLPAGTYFLVLQTTTERKTVRFVVNK